MDVPRVDGTVSIDGLSAPVQVRRDRWGVPHLRAHTQRDLFLAQGFVQAQDRLFQMDLWRRSAQGRLSEVLGPSFIQRDIMTRRIQYRAPEHDLSTEWASYGPDARTIAAAFAEGVNAAVREARKTVPEEFRLAGWLPEFWRAEDLLNRTEAFTADGSALDDVLRARLAAAIGSDRVERLWPGDGRRSAAESEVDARSLTSVVSDGLRRIGPPAVFSGLAAPLTAPGAGASSRTPLQPGPRPEPGRVDQGVAWAGARGGDRPASLLAVSETSRLTVPAARYLIHLTAPGWNVIGATAPWRPGVAIGHNDRVAWAFVGVPADTQDVFVERTNPSASRQVKRPEGWVDAELRRDAVVVKGREESLQYDSLYTDAGVIFALDSDRSLAYALRWVGIEPGTAPELGALAIGRAGTQEAFDAAVGHWKAPAAEFVYADVVGHVARRRVGITPVRRGMTGTLPEAAWAGGGWMGWAFGLPDEDQSDPRSRLVQSTGRDRAAQRVSEVLGRLPAFDRDAFRALQRDVRSSTADALVPLLDRLHAERPDVERARQQLLAWNREMAADGAAAVDASLFAAWEDALRRALAARWVPSDLIEDVLSRFDVPLERVLPPADRAWTDGQADRDRLLLDALTVAVERTASGQPSGSVPRGGRRAVTFVHPLAVTSAAQARFNIGPVVVAGDAGTVQRVVTTRSGEAAGSALRAVFDTGHWDSSTVTLAPGQSEHVSSAHYGDLVQTWAPGEGTPLVFSDDAVAASTTSTLMLAPR